MSHAAYPFLFGRPHGVLSETEAVRTTIGGLRRVSDSLRDDDVMRTPIEARRLLANLSANLTVYYGADEARGYFNAILDIRPDLEDDIATLHEARERLQSSVTSVRRLAFRSTDLHELGLSIGLVLDDFDEQERSENGLLQKFFQTEGGTAIHGPRRA